jgi:hypothetical protein
MGKPKKIGKCGELFGPIPESEVAGCVTDYLYAATFAPYNPVYYIVIGTVPISSP